MDPAWASAAMNTVMATVWLVYLTLFYRELKTQHKVRVFVQQQNGYALDSVCTLINLSDKPVSFDSLQLCLHRQDAGRIVDITGAQMPLTSDGQAASNGAVASGESVNLGSFGRLLALAAPGAGAQAEGLDDATLDDIQEFQIRLVIMHGASDHPLAIHRSFVLEAGTAGWGVVPAASTVQWTGRKGRRLARDWTRSNIEYRGLIE